MSAVPPHGSALRRVSGDLFEMGRQAGIPSIAYRPALLFLHRPAAILALSMLFYLA
jgi:hypothetical protein